MKKIISQIPNFITSLNLVSGFSAVVFAIDGHLAWAGFFICLAAVFDFLDGFVARLLKAYSDIGKQLDSLADVVSFGVAPGAIFFTLLEFSMFGINRPVYEISANWYEWLALFSAFLIPVFGAIRLARFNVSTENNAFFRGLPIPANGLIWASLGLIIEDSGNNVLFEIIFSTQAILFLGLFTSIMMVSNLHMFSLKFKTIKFEDNWFRCIFLILSLGLILSLKFYGLIFCVFAYILLNILFYFFKIKL
ncbi:MAG: CDP-diacylglycerol--serine O-phosphatidyltransferase [Bacteroidales bacterium]|jgi:CDP-diacylglycerol--serine O-phosphatidyltransferase|nr:CDP-diacylglycerol--serine O-phosphatidyltransferase [Bacteroidales bacterium]